jgi:hypothetical protein
MNDEPQYFDIGFTASDGRKATLFFGREGDRIEMRVTLEGSDELQLIGESADIGITMVDGDTDGMDCFFKLLNS